MRNATFVLVLLVSLTGFACSNDAVEAGPFPAECRLPSPTEEVDIARVPEGFILDPETEVRSVERIDGLLVVAMNVPMSVEESYEAYKGLLDEPPFEMIGHENEGFEMELYARDGSSDDLVAIQARNPGCDSAVSIYLQIGRVDSPVGKGSG